MNARSARTLIGASLACVTLAAAGTAVARPADVSAEISATETTVGFPVTLYVSIRDAAEESEPPAPQIKDVDVAPLGAPSRSSQTTIINGRFSQSTSVTYAWELTPRKPGKYTAPAMSIAVDGRTFHTPAMTFEAKAIEPSEHLLAEIAGDRPTAYVGEPVEMTLRVWIEPYHDDRYDVTLSAEDTWNLVLEDRSQWGPFQGTIERMAAEREMPRYREVRRLDPSGEERTYYRFEIEDTVYPQATGAISGGDVQVVVAWPTGLERAGGLLSFGRLALAGTQVIVAEAQLTDTEIKPLPTAGQPADFRGAVGQFDIATEAVPKHVQAGDPITLRIAVRGGPRLDLLQAPPLASLSQLTADFKVGDDPLAGVVRDDVKHFAATLRPRRAGITQIPAIPFSYFDPELGEYRTAKSEPIAIEVTPADKLALGGSDDDASGGDASLAGANGSPQVALSYVNFTGPSVLDWQEPQPDWPWYVAFLLPPAFLVGTVVWQRWNDVYNASPTRRARRAFRHAMTQLEPASTPDRVAAVMLGYVADRCAVPRGGMTRREAIYLLDTMAPQTGAVQEFDRLLSTCESMRFAARPADDAHRLVSEARHCLDQLEHERTSGKER